MPDTKINLLWFRPQGSAKEQLCMLLQKWAPGFFSHFPAQSPLHTKKSPDTLLSISLFFLAVLGLRCFFQAFSSCGQQELLPGCGARAFHHSVFPCCGAWAPGRVGSVGVVRLSCPQHVGSSRTRDWTLDPCTGKRNLYHWTTRKVPTCLTWAGILHPGGLVGPCFLTVCSAVFFSNPLFGWACNSIYWPRYVLSLPGTQIHFFITSSRGQGWGGAFKDNLHLFSCPQKKRNSCEQSYLSSFFQKLFWAETPICSCWVVALLCHQGCFCSLEISFILGT